MNIQDLIQESHNTSKSKGWWAPQCTHEGGYVFNSVQWCLQCGAINSDGTDNSWILPHSAKQRNHGELFMLFVTEIAEAFEEIRTGKRPSAVYLNESKPEGVPIELADLLIRVFDYCGGMDIDLQAALQVKMNYNKSRPYRHGGKLA